MKMIIAILLGLTSANAFARNMDCSNADHSFSYRSFSSNGGAYWAGSGLTYNDVSVGSDISGRSNGKYSISFDSQKTVLVDNDGYGAEIYSVLATGSIEKDGQTIAISEWVICREAIFVPRQCPCPPLKP